MAGRDEALNACRDLSEFLCWSDSGTGTGREAEANEDTFRTF